MKIRIIIDDDDDDIYVESNKPLCVINYGLGKSMNIDQNVKKEIQSHYFERKIQKVIDVRIR